MVCCPVEWISWNDLLHQGQTADVSIIRAKTGNTSHRNIIKVITLEFRQRLTPTYNTHSRGRNILCTGTLTCTWNTVPLFYTAYNNKTTRVWFLREQKHTSDGLWPRNPPRPQVEGVSKPKSITSVFLLPQKSHECRFIFIPCHKNYRKTNFNYGIPHAKFAMSRRRSYDITSTCPTIRMTSLRIPVLTYSAFIRRQN
jgi:hypothetical protein